MIALNSIVAAQLVEFKQTVDAKIAGGISQEQAIFEVLKKYIKESKPIRFDGNGYSDEWKAEAKKRGLDDETSVPVIYDAYTTPEAIQLFESVKVFSERELHARNEVKWETYTKKLQIEARVLGDLVMNHIIPVATKYQSALLDNIYKIHQVYDKDKAAQLSAYDTAIIEEISDRIGCIKSKTEAMVEARKVANKIDDERAKAVAYHDKVSPYFDEIRYQIDKLELTVDDELWTLPKYRELLFVR
jgi:glutamine synthetase